MKLPEHNSKEMINFLLVNALRNLDDAKRQVLIKSLQERSGRAETVVMPKDLQELTNLIAKQALKIDELERTCEEEDEMISEVMGLITCIGGPLNDNKLKYTKPQLAIFARMMQIFSA